MSENIEQFKEYLLKQLEKSDVEKLTRFEFLTLLAKICTQYVKKISSGEQTKQDEIKQFVRQYMLDFQKDEAKTPLQICDELRNEILLLPQNLDEISKMLNTPNNHKLVEKFIRTTKNHEELNDVLIRGIECPEYYLIIDDYYSCLSAQALYDCVQKNDKTTFIELLKRGIKPFGEGESSFWSLSCCYHKTEFLNLVLDNAKIDVNSLVPDTLGSGPEYFIRENPYYICELSMFDYAIQYNHTDIAQKFINKGYDVNHQKGFYGDVMVYACRWCKTQMIKNLADFKFDMTRKYINNETPLHLLVWYHLNDENFAKQSDFSECVKLLVQNGVDINAKDDNGYTPLHIVTKERDVDCVGGSGKTLSKRFCHNAEFMVNCLLENGADPNIRYNKGNTSLHFAMCYGMNGKTLSIVEKLLQYGAKSDISNGAWLTPCKMAFELLQESPLALKNDAQQILKLCQDAKPSLLAKLTRYFVGMQRSV